MLTVAYLANRFPAAVEPYVVDEIGELKRRGTRVIAGSVCKASSEDERLAACEIVLRPAQGIVLLRAAWLCARHWHRITPLVLRILFHGNEGPTRRAKALVHTFLGACYAVRLKSYAVDHLHVHHGFSASWIAMVAARLLGVEFSMMLHGSDLLLHRAYLDVKLTNCEFCQTVSEYNRRFILSHYPGIEPRKILVTRLGVNVPKKGIPRPASHHAQTAPFRILAVGRLHPVKDHAFLIQACAQLRSRGVSLQCEIAGEGPERHHLESQIRKNGLEGQVKLLGHTPREHMDLLYGRADVVVLTSRSEGIPLVLMEAMARGKLVLAPGITGIPELVIAGKTGFLYQPGSIEDFVRQLLAISLRSVESPLLAPTTREKWGSQTDRTYSDRADDPSGAAIAARRLDWVRHAARVQVHHNFNREKNLELFADRFLMRLAPQLEDILHENLVLQQI